MQVHVEVIPSADNPEEKQRASDELAKRIKEIVGISCKVDVSAPGSVQRSEGKAKRVIDNRNGG